MPTSWSDNFTHDYFADSTYTLVEGAEGTDFTIATHAMTVTGNAFWMDLRTVQAFPYVSTMTLAAGSLTSAQVVLGLVNSSVSNFLYCELTSTGFIALAETTSGFHESTGSYTYSGDALTFSFSLDSSGNMSATTDDGGAFSWTVPDANMTDALATSLYPLAAVFG